MTFVTLGFWFEIISLLASVLSSWVTNEPCEVDKLHTSGFEAACSLGCLGLLDLSTEGTHLTELLVEEAAGSLGVDIWPLTSIA